MFTQEEKNFLLKLLNNAQVTGNRNTIPETLAKMDALTKKIEAMPTQDETPGKSGPSMPITKKKSRSGIDINVEPRGAP